jgi:putative phage-type endonuclease
MLVDILNDIEPLPIFNKNEYGELLDYCNFIISNVMSHIVEYDPLYFADESFDEVLWDTVYSQIMLHVSIITELSQGHLTEDIDNIVEEAFCNYYSASVYELSTTFTQTNNKNGDITIPSIVHPRSYANCIVLNPLVKSEIEEKRKKLEILENKPQPYQRTTEWYIFRHNMLTASSIWKALETNSSYNQLIYNKCCPLNTNKYNSVNINSSLHWGQKYEDVSIAIYEEMYGTKVRDYGCIPHDTYPFLGASPDGINIEPNSNRYGRMLEIKNIVNREITGIPKKMYWIQMQMQMEVCDLDECDFLETRFVEYDNVEAFLADKNQNDTKAEKAVNSAFHLNRDGLQTGCMLCFLIKPHNLPIYEYAPIKLTSMDELEQWKQEKITLHEARTNLYFKTIYWKLQEMSCVLVCRNRAWFEAALPFFTKAWETIETERITGYQHRAPKSRNKKKGYDTAHEELMKTFKNCGCLLDVDNLENGGIVDSNKTESETDSKKIVLSNDPDPTNKISLNTNVKSNVNTNANTNIIKRITLKI